MEKPNLTIPMFGRGKVQNSNVLLSQNSEFQCLETPNITIPMFRKAQTTEFQCLELPKFLIPMFGKAKLNNSNVWKRKSAEF